ncbi:MAG TPA: response regulator [Longimicrobiaceae bacterium]|jgi:CheY-like chemotaxis protein
MKTVLLADDFELMHEACGSMLRAGGFRVLHARDTGEAVRLAREEVPSLILMDLMMPGEGGIAAARELRDDPRTAGIPIVAVTAAVALVGTDQLEEEGFSGLLAKPFTLDELMAEVRRYLP